MRTDIAIAFVVMLAMGLASAKREDYAKMVDEVNKDGRSSWKAKLDNELNYDDDNEIKKILGAKLDRDEMDKNENKEWRKKHDADDRGRKLQTTLTAYDLRTAVAGCPSIKQIRNQGQCGSCWAFSTATSLTDRFCIKKAKAGYPQTRYFSIQDILECCISANSCSSVDQGCNGGTLVYPFNFAKVVGVVTGDDYYDKALCKPYKFNPAKVPASTSLTCRKKCPNTLYTAATYVNDKVKTNGYVYLSPSNLSNAAIVQAAKDAIFNRGSIVAGFDVYSDFMVYKSGVYQKTASATYEGGHGVKVIGWGYDSVSKLNYWIFANSWGTGWGMSGFGWFKMGGDHCNFESYLVEGLML